jgi:hypothetical protein
MTVQYEALVGNLFVVGGRVISSPPPGATVQVAPKRAPRIREQDTLFVLITPAGQTNATANFFEQLVKIAADSYFGSRLGVTGALREAARALNQHVQDINQKQAADYRAGALLLAKRGEEVYILRSGTTLCAARLADLYTTFPRDPDMLNILPLGSQSEPVVEFTYFDLNANDIFLLGDAGIAGLTDAFLKDTICNGDIETILDKLETAVNRQASATIIQFIDANAAPSLPPEPLTSEAPTQVVTETSPFSEPTVVLEKTVEFEQEAITGPETAKPDGVSQAAVEVLTSPTETDESSPITEAPDGVPQPTSATDLPISEETEVDAADNSKGAQDDKKFRRRSRKKREAINTVADPSAEKPQNLPKLVFLGMLMLASNALRAVSNGMNALLDRLLPEPEEGTRSQHLIPMNIVALSTVLIPAIVAIVVVGAFISNRDSTAFEDFRAETISAQREAVTLEEDLSATDAEKRDKWLEVRNWANQARQENRNSEEIREIIANAQNYIDFYDRIIRVEVTSLREFEDNADLRGPILSRSGEDIYVLDRNRSQVFVSKVDSSGRRILNTNEIAVLERGRFVNNSIVSNIVDIEWLTEGGVGEPHVLVALDDDGLLIAYNGTLGASAIQLEKPPQWNRPEAIALFNRNFYVLDAGANQIWRYVPDDGFYQNPPSEYFEGDNRPDLTQAVDMGIDDEGRIYILFSNGTISRYIAGQPTGFDLYDSPVDGINDGQALFVSTDPRDYGLYIADQDNEAIYQISQGGTVNGGYRPLDLLSKEFDGVSGVYSDAVRDNLYVLSNNTLYVIVSPRQTNN